ncbi:MAG: hypothetical protein JWM90_1730 [Thermoleophilia bacterium]|nr:hypothetical protein [Thermoleophilia bacterium]
MQKTTKRTKLIAFVPALVVIGITAFAASGASIITGATAASSIGVGGSVTTSITTNPTVDGSVGGTGCASETIGTTFANASGVSDGCQITFSSNGGNGAEVRFENAETAAGQIEAFFCADADGAGPGTRTCTAPAGRLEDRPAAPGALAADQFGIALRAVAGDGGTPTAGAGVAAADASPLAGDLIWVGVPANGASAQLCHSTAPNTTGTTCDFVFGGYGAGTASQGSGDYTGTLNVTTTLR